MAQKQKTNEELNDNKGFRNDTLKKMPKIFKLNDDCMLHIFSFLLIKERLRIQRVCKKWQALINLPWNDIKKLKITFSMESFDQYIKFTPPILKQVLQHCGTSLKNLTLISCKGLGLNNNVIVLLTKKCPNVGSLDTTDMYITRKMMESIAGFRNLTHFTIGKCWNNCEEAVSQIFLANKNLRSVEFHECWNLHQSCLSSLPTDAIESIGFGRNCRFNTEVVCKLMSKLKNLKTLVIDNEILTYSLDKLLIMLPVKSNLKELYFPRRIFSHSGSLHDNYIRNLCLFTNLRKLTLIGGRILDDEQLRIIGQHCRSLIFASLTNSQRVTDSGMRDFVKLLNLEELKIGHLDSITNESLGYINMPSLKIFTYSDCARLNIRAFYMLMIGATNLEQLKLYCQLGYMSLATLISYAKKYTENRSTNKVLKITFTSETGIPSIYKASTRLTVDIRAFPVWPRLNPPAVSSTSPESSSSSNSLPDDDSSSTSSLSSSYASRNSSEMVSSPCLMAHFSSSPSILEENSTGNYSSPAESVALSNNFTSSNTSSRNSSPTSFLSNNSPTRKQSPIDFSLNSPYAEQPSDSSSKHSLPINSPARSSHTATPTDKLLDNSLLDNSTSQKSSSAHSSSSSSSHDSDSS